MRYKVGDKVVIRKDLDLVLGGKTTKITGIAQCYYEFEIDRGEAYWNENEIDHEATAKLKGGQQMTKSDLKNGMVVELRNGNKKLVLNNKMVNDCGYLDFDLFTSDLKHTSSSHTIIKIYETKGRYFDELLLEDYLTLLWQRQEKSEAEIKLEQIQKQIAEMKAKTAEIEQTVEDLKGKV